MSTGCIALRVALAARIALIKKRHIDRRPTVVFYHSPRQVNAGRLAKGIDVERRPRSGKSRKVRVFNEHVARSVKWSMIRAASICLVE